jgi:hypothetical protein
MVGAIYLLVFALIVLVTLSWKPGPRQPPAVGLSFLLIAGS